MRGSLLLIVLLFIIDQRCHGFKSYFPGFHSAQYNGDEIEAYYSNRPLMVWERLVDLGSPILGWWILTRVDKILDKFLSEEERKTRVNIRAADLKDAIVQGKSIAFIKSGQALALRPDIVKSPEYIRELTKLQDEVGTFDNNLAMSILRDELGMDPFEVYDFDPPTPIASASIGQVYRARLRETREEVAVKVQRPDAIETVGIDLFLIRRLAAYVQKQKKLRTNLVGIADEFGAQLYQELNYTNEAHNCIKFKQLYGDVDGVYVPSSNLNLTRRKVLTMEFVNGVKGPWSSGGERMLTVGLKCSVLQLLGIKSV